VAVTLLVKMVEEMAALVEDNQAVEHLDNQKVQVHLIKVLMEEQVLLLRLLLEVAAVVLVLLVKILQEINNEVVMVVQV